MIEDISHQVIVTVVAIALLASLAFLSIHDGPETVEEGNSTDETAGKCSTAEIEIVSADGENAEIAQTDGDEPLGNLSVMWWYQEKVPAQRFGNIDSLDANLSLNSPESGSLNRVVANSVDCGDVQDTYYP